MDQTKATAEPEAQATAEAAAGLAEEAAACVDEVAAELEKLRAENADLKDRFIRALAEAENMRKRAERDRREAEAYAAARFARDMLAVYDNLRRALEAAGPEQRAAAEALIEGVELTMRELLNTFARHGIERIAPQVGETFDPQLHEAMFEAPVQHIAGGGIIQVMTEGFRLHDRLLRPAQVGVSSAPAAAAR